MIVNLLPTFSGVDTIIKANDFRGTGVLASLMTLDLL